MKMWIGVITFAVLGCLFTVQLSAGEPACWWTQCQPSRASAYCPAQTYAAEQNNTGCESDFVNVRCCVNETSSAPPPSNTTSAPPPGARVKISAPSPIIVRFH